MRVRLKGLKTVTKRLADGRIVRYWYAWRGGPRLNGLPGTPEFIASYNAAVAEIPKSQTGTLDFILEKFQDSDAFLSRAPRLDELFARPHTLQTGVVSGHVERDLPRMIEPGRLQQPDLAHDLRPEMKRRAGLPPGRIRQARP